MGAPHEQADDGPRHVSHGIGGWIASLEPEQRRLLQQGIDDELERQAAQ